MKENVSSIRWYDRGQVRFAHDTRGFRPPRQGGRGRMTSIMADSKLGGAVTEIACLSWSTSSQQASRAIVPSPNTLDEFWIH